MRPEDGDHHNVPSSSFFPDSPGFVWRGLTPSTGLASICSRSNSSGAHITCTTSEQPGDGVLSAVELEIPALASVRLRLPLIELLRSPMSFAAHLCSSASIHSGSRNRNTGMRPCSPCRRLGPPAVMSQAMAGSSHRSQPIGPDAYGETTTISALSGPLSTLLSLSSPSDSSSRSESEKRRLSEV